MTHRLYVRTGNLRFEQEHKEEKRNTNEIFLLLPMWLQGRNNNCIAAFIRSDSRSHPLCIPKMNVSGSHCSALSLGPLPTLTLCRCPFYLNLTVIFNSLSAGHCKSFEPGLVFQTTFHTLLIYYCRLARMCIYTWFPGSKFNLNY